MASWALGPWLLSAVHVSSAKLESNDSMRVQGIFRALGMLSLRSLKGPHSLKDFTSPRSPGSLMGFMILRNLEKFRSIRSASSVRSLRTLRSRYTRKRFSESLQSEESQALQESQESWQWA